MRALFEKRPSIAKTLTRMNMLVSATALVLACSGFVTYDLIAFRAAIIQNLSIQAQIAGSNSVSALTFDDPSTAARTLSSFKLSPDIVSARIYTAAGRPFATYERDKTSHIPPKPQIQSGDDESHWFADRNAMLTHTIVFRGKLAGYVFIESDLQRLIARLKTYILIAGFMLVQSLFAALFVSRIARRAIAGPVVKLADAARHVSCEKDYGVRVAPGKEGGELAVLVATFNEMLDQIEAQDRSLRAASDDLERRVTERTAELAAANKELESFSYSVSHDLRAPLRSIDGFSQMLEDDYAAKLDVKARTYIQKVRAATQRMGQLIDDLLNLARVSRFEMQRESVNLSEISHSIASEFSRASSDRRVEWVIAPHLRASGDPRLLRIVLDNLLGNAWKYTSRHEHARIEFGQINLGGAAAYFVKDDGAGFDVRYTNQLFRPFQRLHGVEEFSGTGVGLATVHRIVERHGGRIWAEAAVEKGATFYFILGAQPCDSAPIARDVVQTQAVQVTTELGN